jgi:hypothetical protein
MALVREAKVPARDEAPEKSEILVISAISSKESPSIAEKFSPVFDLGSADIAAYPFACMLKVPSDSD